MVVLHYLPGCFRKIADQPQQFQAVAGMLGHQVLLRLGQRLRLAQDLARDPQLADVVEQGPMPTWRIASAGNLHSRASSMLSTLTLRE